MSEELPMADPGLDSIEEEDLRALIAEKERGPLPRGTKVLLGAIGIALAFFAGSFAQQHFGPSSSGDGFPGGGAAFGRFAAGGIPGAGSAGGQAGTASATTIGSITLVDGTNVYVTDSQGKVVKVKVSPDTAITAQTTVKSSDLKAGQQVIVRGETGTDGTVAASTIAQGALPGGLTTQRSGASQ